MPCGRTELPGAHDLGADPGLKQPQERVVDARRAAGLAEHLATPSGREHPLVQPLAGMAERGVKALVFAGGETVERDGDMLDTGE
jgi:hypothetical protein